MAARRRRTGLDRPDEGRCDSPPPAERYALVEAGVRAFCLTNAQLRAADQTPVTIGLTSFNVSGPRHHIAEHEVCTLRSQVGDWPAGTEGTAVGIYEDEGVIELSGLPMDEAPDNLIVVPADKLEVVWRPGDPPLSDMEA